MASPRSIDDLPPGPATRALLAGVGRRRVVYRVIDGLSRATLLISGWLLVVGVVDRGVPLGAMARASLLAALVIALVVGAWRWLQQLRRERADPLHDARLIERTHPPLRDRLVTLLAPASSSPLLLRQLAAMVERQCGDLQSAQLVSSRRLLRPLRLPTVPLLLLVGLWLWSPTGSVRTLTRLALPLRDLQPPDRGAFLVAPGDVELRPGQSLRIEVRRPTGFDDVTATPDAAPRVIWQGGGVRRAETMTPTSDGFALSLDGLAADAWYEIEWNGRRSARHHVRLLHPPGVRSMQAWQREGVGVVGLDSSMGRIAAPVGSRVELAIEATQPLSSATLESGSTRLSGTIGDDGSRAVFLLTVERDGVWRVRLEGGNGLESDPRLRLEVVAIADDPPVVRTTTVLPRVSARGQVRLPYFAGDDHALASVRVLRDGSDVVFGRLPTAPATRVMQGLAVFERPSSTTPAVATLRFEARDSRGAVALGEPVMVLLAGVDIGVFDQLRPAMLQSVLQSLEGAINALQRLETSLVEPTTAMERRDETADRLRRGIESVVVTSTDADERWIEPLTGLADRLASLRREVMELPPEPARATDVSRLRRAVERERSRADDLRRAALAWLIRADAATASATTRPASRELSATLERARRERQAWARELGVRLEDRELPGKLDRLLTDAGRPDVPDVPGLLRNWVDGASSESIADRLVVRARVRALSRRPRPTSVADTITLAGAVRGTGRADSEASSGARERLLDDWEDLQEARSAGAVFAVARVQRRLRAMGVSESEGLSVLLLADEASSAGDPLLDLADRWRALRSVADRLDPADVELLQRRLLDEAQAILEPSADLPSSTTALLAGPRPDTADVLTRLAEELAASRFQGLLWRSGEASESLRAALNPEPTRGLPRTLTLLSERVGRLLESGGNASTPPSARQRDDEAVRAYFRLLSREIGD